MDFVTLHWMRHSNAMATARLDKWNPDRETRSGWLKLHHEVQARTYVMDYIRQPDLLVVVYWGHPWTTVRREVA